VASGQGKSDTAFNPKVRKTSNEDSLDLLDLWPWLHGATLRIWSSSKLTTHVNCQSEVGWYLMTTPLPKRNVAGSFKATTSTNQCLVSSPSTSATSVLESKLLAPSESLETTEETGREKRKRDPSPLNQTVMADDAAECQGGSTAAEPPLERQYSNKRVKRSFDVQRVQRVRYDGRILS